ncbi:hypothetical protein PLEOSDRAFT_1111869 [Pleurotus ostreatus PC15]|uniref:Uncharacterized protein n=1 Tax=Pleurotus ostreatus (strain PC15) TaxID=1137138 RepID=A0A067NUK3_PLEO1|nr:hypothetical protein PLEOSDRAFT_1111869 [Pleurotus ostreatus PC15]
MSLSSSAVPFPTSSTSSSTSTSSGSSRSSSLLAKWNRDARLSISSKSIPSTQIVISAPLPLGSGVRRDSLIPRPPSSSKKRAHKEIVANENLDIDDERARVRQRTTSEATLTPSTPDLASPPVSTPLRTAEGVEPTRAVARDGAIAIVQARPGQAKKTLKALRDRLRIHSTRGPKTEDAVAPSVTSGSQPDICPPSPTPRQADGTLSKASRCEELDRVPVPRPDVARNGDKCNENGDENHRDPRPSSKPQRGGPKSKTVHFLLAPTDLEMKAYKEMARRPADLAKSKSPLQQRNANLSHVASTSPRAVPAKAFAAAAKAEASPVSATASTVLLRRDAVFKPPVSLTAEQLKLGIAFYNSPHFEIWDMEDDIFVAWPAELRLEALDSDRWEFTSLIQPEILRVALECHSKYYCKDGDHTKYPYAICDADSWYSVAYGGAVCRDGMRSAVVPAAGIHVAAQWERTYKRRADPLDVEGAGARRPKAREVPAERGWVLRFWIPIPTHLFVKRETRSFVIEAKVWLADDARELPHADKALAATAEMTISHLRRAREMI